MDNLNPLGEIKEKEIFSSGFTWRPEILKKLDYKSIHKQYDLLNTELIIICGVSTSGKDTLLHKSTTDLPIIPRSTSRSPRPGEVNGINYFFGVSDALLWSTYAGNTYAVTEKLFDRLAKEKRAIMINGIVYAPTMKALLEKLGVKVKIAYIMPGRLTGSLQSLQNTVMNRLPIRDEKDKRITSVMEELQAVFKNKEYLQKLGVIFIENESNEAGYSPNAVEKLKILLK